MAQDRDQGGMSACPVTLSADTLRCAKDGVVADEPSWHGVCRGGPGVSPREIAAICLPTTFNSDFAACDAIRC